MKSLFLTYLLLILTGISATAQELTAADFERMIVDEYARKDMKSLDLLLTRYHKSGLYPEDVLRYNYNELQGMEDWGVIIMSSAESLIGKLILQRVLNVHRDKVLVCTELGGLDSLTCDRLGIPQPPADWKQEEFYEKTMRWVFDHVTDRAVYFPFTDSPLFKLFPVALKENIYNEGLTMRYSTVPYDNISIKIRNLEERYLTDYLKLTVHPYIEDDDHRLYKKFTPGILSLNYSAIYLEILPYYREHKPDRVEWLLGLYGACRNYFNRISFNRFYHIEQ